MRTLKTLSIYRQQFARLFSALAALAERTADTPITGPTVSRRSSPLVSKWPSTGRHLERIDNLSLRAGRHLSGAVPLLRLVPGLVANGVCENTGNWRNLSPPRTHLDRAGDITRCDPRARQGNRQRDLHPLQTGVWRAGEPVPEGAGQFDDASEAKSRNGPRPDGRLGIRARARTAGARIDAGRTRGGPNRAWSCATRSPPALHRRFARAAHHHFVIVVTSSEC